MKKIDKKMAEMIKQIHKKGGYMSTREVAEATGFAYLTVEKYLKQLEEKKIVFDSGNKSFVKKKNKRGAVKRWQLNYKLILSSNRDN